MDTLKVTLFGSITISGMGGELNVEKLKSQMLSKLLLYFFAHQGRAITAQELIDALWPDEESENPIGALRNLVYRLRNVVKKEWPDAQLILTKAGTYFLNSAIQFDIDTLQFEQLTKKASQETDMEKRLSLYRELLPLYRGTFGQGMEEQAWILSSSAYYHNLYLVAVKEAAALLESSCLYEELEQTLRAALEREELDEELHAFLVRALMLRGKVNPALRQYDRSTAILYERLGVSNPVLLRKAYEGIMKQEHESEINIDQVEQDLREGGYQGAFYCEYGVFKQIYQLEVRRAERMHVPLYLSLITVGIEIEKNRDDGQSHRSLSEALDMYRRVLQSTLRAGDVFTRYSRNQFILLLPTCQKDTADLVMKRIEKAFLDRDRSGCVRVRYNLADYE